MPSILDIGKSKLRKELLGLYFTNPEQEYYLRELARLLGFPVQNIQRELARLEQSGLFRSRRAGNLRYYRLNREHPLYSELESIVFKTVGIEGSLRQIVEADPGIDLAFIYGSFAAGEPTRESDVDVLVVGAPDESQIIDKVRTLEEKLQREINYTTYSQEEFRRRLQRKDSFLDGILAGPKIALKGNPDELR